MTKPRRDIAHLGRVGVYTDKFNKDVDFFVRTSGLTESGGENSASLRARDDYEFDALKLPRHDTTGVGHSPVEPASQTE